MPVETVVDKKIGLIIRTVTGELTFEDIKSAFEASLTHPEFYIDMPVIWDLQKADASKLNTQDVIRIARYFELQLKKHVDFKAAIVVSRDLEYGLSRMYQVAVADLPPKIGIFRDLEDAKKWVMASD
jgi:hypothetical protein